MEPRGKDKMVTHPASLVNARCLLLTLLFIGSLMLPSANADSLATSVTISLFPNCANSGSGTASCNTTGTLPYGIGTALAQATGSVTEKTMGTEAIIGPTATAPGTPFQDPLGENEAGATARAILNYTFNDLPSSLNGGTLVFSMTVGGTSAVICNPGGNSNDCVELEALTDLTLAGSMTEGFVGLGAGSAGVTLPSGLTALEVSTGIGNGTANISLELDSEVTCLVAYTASCSVSSDYFDPLAITGAEAFDSSGNLVSGVPIISESGVSFTPGTVPAPEPPSLCLLGIGVGVLIGVALRRRILVHAD